MDSERRPWNVVIVDDCAEDRAEIRRLLLKGSARHYHFTDVEMGADTQRALQTRTADVQTCLILDFHLPDAEAPEIIDELIGTLGVPVCPIVVVTGSSSGRVGTLAIRAGAQDFIGKSWMTPESLTRAVESAVSRWRMARNIAIHLGVTEILASSSSEKEQLIDNLELIVEQANWTAGAVWLVDPTENVLKCQHIWEKQPTEKTQLKETWATRKLGRDEELAGYVWTHQSCVWWDYTEMGGVQPISLVDAGIRSACAFPLLNQGECMGVIELYCISAAERDPDLIRVLSAIGNQMGQTIQRIRTERSIRENEEKLRQLLHYYDFFIAVLGHDLRNPLGCVLAGADLGVRLTSGEKEKNLFQRIHSSGRRMQRLIDQLLDVTRIRSGGGLALQYAPADLQDLVRNAVDEAIALQGEVPIDFQVSGVTTGEWDADRLAQVLSNLVGNALQHAAGARGIHMRMSNPTPLTIEFCIHNEGAIPQNALPTLFDPFVKASSNPRKSGLGLGLYISQQISIAHGGQIFVHSDPESGTTFFVELPRYPTPQSHALNQSILNEMTRRSRG